MLAHIRLRRGARERGRLRAGLVIPGMAVAGIAMLVLSCGDGAVEPPPPVPAPVATTVTVNPGSATFTALGETARFTAEVRDQSGQVMAGTAVAWASSDASVASVDASGLATAVANGTTTITAASGSVSGTAALTVSQEAAAATVSPDESTLGALGDTVRLSAEALDANGHAIAHASFEWMSDDTAVATVDASGLVTAVGNGAATVTATAGLVSATATVTVMAAPRSAPPTYVFAEGIPESTRTLIRSEMEYSRAYFASEHGVEATGFTVMVGHAADALALAPSTSRRQGSTSTGSIIHSTPTLQVGSCLHYKAVPSWCS